MRPNRRSPDTAVPRLWNHGNGPPHSERVRGRGAKARPTDRYLRRGGADDGTQNPEPRMPGLRDEERRIRVKRLAGHMLEPFAVALGDLHGLARVDLRVAGLENAGVDLPDAAEAVHEVRVEFAQEINQKTVPPAWLEVMPAGQRQAAQTDCANEGRVAGFARCDDGKPDVPIGGVDTGNHENSSLPTGTCPR